MDFLEFASEIGRLKEIKRTGWINKSVKNPESVADHSFRLAVLAMLYAEESNLNSEKCMKMALVHDMAEIYTGDIPRHDKEKIEKEEQALKRLLEKLPDKMKKEITDLWEEFAAKKSKEAMLVSDLDKIEMLIQAVDYKKQRRAENMDEFFATTEEIIKTELGKELLKCLKAQYLSIKN
jgi:putative hydrolase of HD superfamily